MYKYLVYMALKVSLSCFSGFCIVLDPRNRLEGKVGSACEEFEDDILG